MQLRRPLDLFFAVGSLGWPVGLFALGGFDDDAGTIVIGVGSLVVLATMASELLLRRRDARQRSVPPDQSHR